MTTSIIIQNVNEEDLQNLITSAITTQLNAFKKDLINIDAIEELMTRKQTYEFLKINSSTLWAWTNKGKVKAYAISNRRYYKRSELISALRPLKIS